MNGFKSRLKNELFALIQSETKLSNILNYLTPIEVEKVEETPPKKENGKKKKFKKIKILNKLLDQDNNIAEEKSELDENDLKQNIAFYQFDEDLSFSYYCAWLGGRIFSELFAFTIFHF